MALGLAERVTEEEWIKFTRQKNAFVMKRMYAGVTAEGVEKAAKLLKASRSFA